MPTRTVLASLLLLVPLPVAGQSGFRDFGMFCTPGMLRACASVSTWTVHQDQNGFLTTDVYWRVSNLQGRPGFASGPRGLRSFTASGLSYVSGRAIDGIPGDAVFEGNTAQGGQPYGAPVDFAHVSYAGESASLSWNFDHVSYLYGCDVPWYEYEPNMSGFDSTCGGFITYRIRYIGDHFVLNDATQLTLAWTGLEEDANGVGSSRVDLQACKLEYSIVSPK